MNKDRHRFWVRIKDVKGLKKITATWDTYGLNLERTSFESPATRRPDESEITLWEESAVDDRYAYYSSPWLIVTSTRWDVDRLDIWTATSSGLPTAASPNVPGTEILPGEPGFRIRRGCLLGENRITYRGSAASCRIWRLKDVLVLRLRLIVLRRSTRADDQARREYRDVGDREGAAEDP